MEPACVLVVDDDEEIRETVAEVLADEGFRVRTAADGEEALEKMRACAPSMVLLDLMMPVMNGWQVVEEMGGDQALREIPVCIVSAVAERAPSGARRVIGKPVSIDDLLAAVTACCGDRLHP